MGELGNFGPQAFITDAETNKRALDESGQMMDVMLADVGVDHQKDFLEAVYANMPDGGKYAEVTINGKKYRYNSDMAVSKIGLALTLKVDTASRAFLKAAEAKGLDGAIQKRLLGNAVTADLDKVKSRAPELLEAKVTGSENIEQLLKDLKDGDKEASDYLDKIHAEVVKNYTTIVGAE